MYVRITGYCGGEIVRTRRAYLIAADSVVEDAEGLLSRPLQSRSSCSGTARSEHRCICENSRMTWKLSLQVIFRVRFHGALHRRGFLFMRELETQQRVGATFCRAIRAMVTVPGAGVSDVLLDHLGRSAAVHSVRFMILSDIGLPGIVLYRQTSCPSKWSHCLRLEGHWSRHKSR